MNEGRERAESTESDRVTRYRRWSLAAASVAVLSVMGVMAAGLTANDARAKSAQAQADLATAQFQVTLSAFQGYRLATIVPGIGQMPPTQAATMQPLDAFATATQIAAAYRHDDDVIQTFDGVEMVLVPAGCFLMGSAAISDTVPVNQVCFDQPFWIDKTEVTNEQFHRLGGTAALPSYFCDPNQDGTISGEERVSCAQRPREEITWFEARDFCLQRGARLPTEAEWEYAARGPDSWLYPWGNTFVADNVVYIGNSNYQTADVGHRPGGASWAGALDMSGNVSEWVSTAYATYENEGAFPYPYNPNDGREDMNRTGARRAVRGGSFFGGDPEVRAASRDGVSPGGEFDDTGVRCAHSS